MYAHCWYCTQLAMYRAAGVCRCRCRLVHRKPADLKSLARPPSNHCSPIQSPCKAQQSVLHGLQGHISESACRRYCASADLPLERARCCRRSSGLPHIALLGIALCAHFLVGGSGWCRGGRGRGGALHHMHTLWRKGRRGGWDLLLQLMYMLTD